MILEYITWNVDPILFKIGQVRVGWYGLLLASGFFLAYLVFQKIAKNEKIDLNLIDKFSLLTVLWTVVGLRLVHCIFYQWDYFQHHILEIFIPFEETANGWEFTGFAGLASHGAVIAIILFVLYFSFKHKMNILWLLDRLSIAIPLAAAFVRCGNLMNHEICGLPTNVPWAFHFITNISRWQNGAAPVFSLPSHPTQIYEAMVYLSLFAYQMWYYFKHTKGRIPAGRSVGTLLTVIFTARFFIEFIKEVQVPFEESMFFNMGQWLSIPFILLGITLLYYSFAKKTYPKAIKK